MSTALVNSGVQFPDGSIQTTASSGGTGFKNRMINGAMMVDQYAKGAPVIVNSSNAFSSVSSCVDMYGHQQLAFASGNWGPAVMTSQQNLNNITPPPGFVNYLGYVVTTADPSPSATTDYIIRGPVEELYTSDLGWGTASAKSVTVSFWVQSNLTGTFGAHLCNRTPNNFYPFSYTITAANTWQHVSITIPPDSAAIGNSNIIGLRMGWSLGLGSNFQSNSTGSWITANSTNAAATVVGEQQVCSAVGNTFYLTGVQIETGSTATAFDYRPYPIELALCQRYAQRIGGTDANEIIGFGNWVSASTATVVVQLFSPMRSAETVLASTASTFCVGFGTIPCSSVALSVSGTRNIDVIISIPNGSQVPGTGCVLRANGTTSTYLLITSGV